MSQVIKSGDVLTKKIEKEKKDLKNINQLDGLETNLKISTVRCFLFFCFLLITMQIKQIRVAGDFEAFCILDFKSVQQSTLFCSPLAEKRLNLYCGVDILQCKSCFKSKYNSLAELP